MERLLSKKQVREIVSFSLTHIDRLSHEPEYAHLGFPKPIKIGHRVFYRESKINDWVAFQIATSEAS